MQTARQPENAQILLIEDEERYAQLIAFNLRSEGFRVISVGTAAQALTRLEQQPFDLILLDLGLPDQDGLLLAQQLRDLTDAPLLMVTARANLMDKVNGLQAGADDYLTKPFAIPELVARVQAQLRRYRHQTRLGLPVAGLKLAELEIDFVRRRVRQQEQEIRLSSIEYRLLEYLARNVEYVLAHDLLVEKVWGSEQVGDHHLLHLTVNRLRQKLGTSRRYLQTRPGLGYILTAG